MYMANATSATVAVRLRSPAHLWHCWNMHWIDRMNLGQRIIVIISLGMALAVGGSYIVNGGGDSGWVGYAPLTTAISVPGLSPALRLVVWLGLIAIWALASVVLLRSPRSRGGSQ